MTSTIESLSNDWYKISITTTSVVTALVPQIFVLEDSYTTGLPILLSYTGDGTSGVYIFMAQFEVGSAATSPTFTDTTLAAEGSTTTRLADVVTGGVSTALYSDVNSSGTLFIEFTHVNTPLYKSIALMNVAETSIIRIYTYFNILYLERLKTGEPTISIPVDVSAFENSTIKAAFRWALNDFKGCINGTLTTGATGVVFGANDLAKLDFRSAAGSIPFYGDLKQIQVYGTALTDAECITLTTL